jgi:putative two-component system response regulator
MPARKLVNIMYLEPHQPKPSNNDATLLVVDDHPGNLMTLIEILDQDYKLRIAKSGYEALEVANSSPMPDLILLDIMMPDLDGYDVLDALKNQPRTSTIPVIFVTAKDQTKDEEIGLESGAVDYVTKPVRPGILRARVRNHLELKRARDEAQNHNKILQSEVARRIEEIRRVQSMSVDALAELAKIRDNETGNHIRRTQEYVRILATQLLGHPRHANDLSPEIVDLIAKSAPLHDIGKVGIPDSILLKPGRLTDQEWEIMKTHAALGTEALELAERRSPEPHAYLQYAKQIARHHHEKWDGSGYPDQLAGENIPLAARLMAVADVFDALISKRSYKPSWSYAEALKSIVEGSNTHFDPIIVDAFRMVFDECVKVAERFAD